MSFGGSPSYNPAPPAAGIGLTPEEKAAQEDAARVEKEKLKKRRGFESTLLTGASGVMAPASTDKKTLLGS